MAQLRGLVSDRESGWLGAQGQPEAQTDTLDAEPTLRAARCRGPVSDSDRSKPGGRSKPIVTVARPRGPVSDGGGQWVQANVEVTEEDSGCKPTSTQRAALTLSAAL